MGTLFMQLHARSVVDKPLGLRVLACIQIPLVLRRLACDISVLASTADDHSREWCMKAVTQLQSHSMWHRAEVYKALHDLYSQVHVFVCCAGDEANMTLQSCAWSKNMAAEYWCMEHQSHTPPLST